MQSHHLSTVKSHGENLLEIIRSYPQEYTLALIKELDAADLNSIKNNYGSTALIIATEKGHTDIALLLIEKGADLNIKNRDGDTALIIATEKGHTDIAHLLIEKGANVNIRNEGGDTALIVAAEKRHTDIAHLLIEKG